MSAWTKMYDTADTEPLGELFSECWRDQSAWISHKVAWGKRNEIRPHVLRAWWNTRLPVRRRLAAHSGSAKLGAEIRESETALGKPPFLHQSVFDRRAGKNPFNECVAFEDHLLPYPRCSEILEGF